MEKPLPDNALERIPTTEGYFARTFFLLIICPLAAGALAGVILAAIAAVDAFTVGVSVRTARLVAAVVGSAVGLATSYLLFRRVAIKFIAPSPALPPARAATHDETPKGMRLEFRMRYTDYLLFNVVHAFLSPLLQAILVGFSIFIFFMELGDSTIAESLVTAVRWFVLIWIAQVAYLAAALHANREDTNLTDHVLEVRDDALHDITRFNESRFFWPGVLRVVRRPGFVAVYVAQHAAQVIPTRAFENKEAQRRFVKIIKERMRMP
jgi:YcxB-like protein